MFMGEYRHSLDAKNRLIIPAKFREELGDTFVVTRGLDGCLSIYTEKQWEIVEEQLQRLPQTNKAARAYTRFMMSGAFECALDSQGRIQLPANLIEHAEIVKQCAVIGSADHVEIWAQEKWISYSDEVEEGFEDLAESLTEYLK